jgi:hypothetical protein
MITPPAYIRKRESTRSKAKLTTGKTAFTILLRLEVETVTLERLDFVVETVMLERTGV